MLNIAPNKLRKLRETSILLEKKRRTAMYCVYADIEPVFPPKKLCKNRDLNHKEKHTQRGNG